MRLISLCLLSNLLLASSVTTTALASSYDLLMGVERLGTGCDEKSIRIDDTQISYNECGNSQGEPVLFIHGFGADKDTWDRVIKCINGDFRMIAIDLPGWGKSSFVSGEDYSARRNATRIDAIREKLGVDSWHVVGWSMGGTMGATYALQHQNRVRSLTLMDSGGFRLPSMLADKSNPVEAAKLMIVKNRDDFDNITNLAFFDPPWMPWFAKDIITEHLAAHSSAESEMLPQVISDITSLGTLFQSYKAPLQVIWGHEDRMMDKSVVDTIRSLRPDASTHVFEKCGHSPLLEKPTESAQLISDFINKNAATAAK